jgi:hypothetical protein
MTARASTTPANRIDASKVFFNGRLISGVIYHADGSKEKRYLRAQFLVAVRVLLIELTALQPEAVQKNTNGMFSGEWLAPHSWPAVNSVRALGGPFICAYFFFVLAFCCNSSNAFKFAPRGSFSPVSHRETV